MDAPSFILGFLAGVFFSLLLSHFLAKKVGAAVYAAILRAREDNKNEYEDDHDDANYWKEGRKKYDDE